MGVLADASRQSLKMAAKWRGHRPSSSGGAGRLSCPFKRHVPSSIPRFDVGREPQSALSQNHSNSFIFHSWARHISLQCLHTPLIMNHAVLPVTNEQQVTRSKKKQATRTCALKSAAATYSGRIYRSKSGGSGDAHQHTATVSPIPSLRELYECTPAAGKQ
jgi:hypothetical protein